MDENRNKDLNGAQDVNDNVTGNPSINNKAEDIDHKDVRKNTSADDMDQDQYRKVDSHQGQSRVEENRQQSSEQSQPYDYVFWADQRNNYNQNGYQQSPNYQQQNMGYHQQNESYYQQNNQQNHPNQQGASYHQQGYYQQNMNYRQPGDQQQNGSQHNDQQHTNLRNGQNFSYQNNNFNQQSNGYNQSNYDYQNRNYNAPYNRQVEQMQKLTPKPKKAPNKLLGWIGKAVIFGAVASAIFLGMHGVMKTINPELGIYKQSGNLLGNGNRTYKISTTQIGAVEYKESSSISDMVENTMPAIVSIHSTTTETGIWFGQQINQDSESSGSGIIVGKDEKELLIATNNHVVSGANKITITFTDESQAEAVIKGTDVAADLAVIAVDMSTLEESTVDAISVVSMGDSDEVKVGEVAVAIGNALGYGQSVTVGYISAKDREVTVSDGYNNYDMLLLQTDAAINAGNSGGALLNIEGELIGINSVKYASSAVEGMGFAIPITRAIPIITELMSREILKESEQGFLGIRGTEITEEISQQLQMPIGVYIGELVEGGAAIEGGLRQADIITSVNGIEITSMIQLREYVTSFRVGTELEVTFMRNVNGVYEEKVITMKLGANPELITEE